MSDKIEQEVIINAPIATVWKIVTNPSQWFGEKAELDLRVGGKGKVSWKEYGEAPLEIIKMDEPNYFAFAWIGPDEETRSTGQQTLVEFELSEEGSGTKLHLTESIYGKRLLSENQEKSIFSKRTGGWGYFADKIKLQSEEL